jgi:hypothetical protein
MTTLHDRRVWWLLAPAVLCVVALTALVTVGIAKMLDETDSDSGARAADRLIAA